MVHYLTPAEEGNRTDEKIEQEVLLEVSGINKRYSGVPVLRDVSIQVRRGEVVGLVGENGAGKSTLSKIVAGYLASDSGTIEFDGRRRKFKNVREAEAAGIVMIPQELQTAPHLTIAENMFAGSLAARGGVVNRRELFRATIEQLRFFNITADPLATLSTLTVSEQRLVMMAARLSKRASLVILDEPTAALTDDETATLFAHVRRLREQGVAWIHVTHRLDELEVIADRVVAMRDGRVAETFESPVGKRRAIVRAMIGSDVAKLRTRHTTPAPANEREVVLSLSNLSVRDPDNRDKFRVKDVSLQLRAGEVLGLFGLVGAGRTELARAIFGSWAGEVSGDVRLYGSPWRARGPADALASGVAMLTEDRKSTGILQGQSVNANISSASIRAVSPGTIISRAAEYRRNQGLARDLGVRPLNLRAAVETLSGGNQQKVLLARWLATNPRILILDEPTIGLDVGARLEVFDLIRKQAQEGRAVLLISSDLEEIVTQADKILVMYKGRINAELPPNSPRHEVMLAATGKDTQWRL
ncbi:MAG: Monosaccharide transporter ATP-binding protein family [Naasia sp.]|jgi:ABC-type sugar transport system ATPase subunit|uniref:sugar ABC transporter ATP-binding protein n=1 Tax=Naasia sp. TaxID=2546198 RepID=UPI00261F0F29|nr:sugar ABC transporter ATP-binding protein [Naasia sp.]MCU1571144.1 Monosaccharide transporter ATP-binding protein family [Naasia sp.]